MEEIGSTNLENFIDKNKSLLKSDVAVVSDIILSENQPALTYALRGALNMEIELEGQKNDLHSGQFGGAIYNPIQGLCELISKFHFKNGIISLPGFYDDVKIISLKEKSYMKEFGESDDKILYDSGAEFSWGESGYSNYERTTIRPSLSICGITGGYQGTGIKSVIPSESICKN